MAVIDWWNGPLTLVVIFFALCLLLLTWSIAGVACRACHSSGTFFSLWHTHTTQYPGDDFPQRIFLAGWQKRSDAHQLPEQIEVLGGTLIIAALKTELCKVEKVDERFLLHLDSEENGEKFVRTIRWNNKKSDKTKQKWVENNVWYITVTFQSRNDFPIAMTTQVCQHDVRKSMVRMDVIIDQEETSEEEAFRRNVFNGQLCTAEFKPW